MLSLNLVGLVYFAESTEAELQSSLLQKSNAWLQRRVTGYSDDLLLIGVGFDDEAAFKVMLKPYGLESADVAIIESEGDDFGTFVEIEARAWINAKHRGAIPVASWSSLVPGANYPASDAWWWVGVESIDDANSTFAAILQASCPDSFREQAQTWVDILADVGGWSNSGEEEDEHEATLQTIALAQWLTGFDAAAENSFYDFSASEAIEAADLDLLRLGFDAGRLHESELASFFDGNDHAEVGLAEACLLACLEGRRQSTRDLLSQAFGAEGQLFWSLYRSIWPDLTEPLSESVEGLLGLKHGDMGEIDRAWRFVSDGWVDFSEE